MSCDLQGRFHRLSHHAHTRLPDTWDPTLASDVCITVDPTHATCETVSRKHVDGSRDPRHTRLRRGSRLTLRRVTHSPRAEPGGLSIKAVILARGSGHLGWQSCPPPTPTLMVLSSDADAKVLESLGLKDTCTGG